MKWKTHMHTKATTAAWSIPVRQQEQPTCPPTGQKVGPPSDSILFHQKNELGSYTCSNMSKHKNIILKKIILNESLFGHKRLNTMILLIWNIKYMQTERQKVDWGVRGETWQKFLRSRECSNTVHGDGSRSLNTPETTELYIQLGELFGIWTISQKSWNYNNLQIWWPINQKRDVT